MRKIALTLATVALLTLGAATTVLATGGRSDFGCDTAQASTTLGAPNSAPGTAAVAQNCPSVP